MPLISFGQGGETADPEPHWARHREDIMRKNGTYTWIEAPLDC
jgi:hypothetical protein